MIRYSPGMRMTTPKILLACALIAAALSFLSDDGFIRLTPLSKGLEQQQRVNAQLEDGIYALKRQVNGLQSDPRAVEKAARSELGMARPDEMVVLFEKKEPAHAEGR